MGRRKTLRTNKYPYHVVARSHNKLWFPLPISEMWPIYLKVIDKVVKDYKVRVYAFTLMNNHFHLMIDTPMSNIDEVMYWIMKLSTLEVQQQSGVINSIYGGRYKSSLLTQANYRANAYKYILQNPVKANMVIKVEAYPYSLSSYFSSDSPFSIFELVDLFSFDLLKKDDVLDWLNNKFSPDEDKSISQGLLRPEFRYGKDSRNKTVEPEVIHPRYTKYDQMWKTLIPSEEKDSNQISLF
ncbi:transposase [Halobacteriovorax sp. RT-2-6]|uniref:transposase n=1 Tax=unclassified Halobacteriovorax TaxID=2639665 RepID=UPI003999F14E